MIENLKHKLIIVSKENEKMNEEMMFMRKRENIILKQFEGIIISHKWLLHLFMYLFNDNKIFIYLIFNYIFYNINFR